MDSIVPLSSHFSRILPLPYYIRVRIVVATAHPKKKNTYPSLFLSIIPGNSWCTYALVQMSRRSTSSADWKLKIAVCEWLAIMDPNRNQIYVPLCSLSCCNVLTTNKAWLVKNNLQDVRQEVEIRGLPRHILHAFAVSFEIFILHTHLSWYSRHKSRWNHAQD